MSEVSQTRTDVNEKWPVRTSVHLLTRLIEFRRNFPQLIQTNVYCATNRNVAGSIPDGVIGIFH
jgi:hypothetical protein